MWDVLANGWLFGSWVVGSSRIRAVDPRWPREGSTIHHSVGVWPLVLNDSTVVTYSRPTEELQLHARALPFGRASIILRLHDAPGGCTVEMLEQSESFHSKWIPTHVQHLALAPRVGECLRRLTMIAEGKTNDR